MTVPPDAPMPGVTDARPRPPGSQREWRDAAQALIAALDQRGLTASEWGHGAVMAVNPNGEPAPDNPLGQLMSPGLRQEVRCRPHGPGLELWWHWVWVHALRQMGLPHAQQCPPHSLHGLGRGGNGGRAHHLATPRQNEPDDVLPP